MAVYADQHAVAASSRSWHQLDCQRRWAENIGGLLDELVTDKLPDQAVSLLASVIEERRQLRAQHGVEQRAREEALARRDQIDERIAELDGDALERVIRLVWTGWNPRLTELRDLIRRRRDALTPRRRTDLFATPPTPGLRRGLWVAGCGLAA